jgi:predicted ATPase
LTPPRLVDLPDGTITARYKFGHILYLEVPYGLLSPMRRAQIHRRIGHSGEAIYGTHVGEIAAELAMHFEQGSDAPRAVRYLLMAAENARNRSAHYEAEALARRGLSALAALAPSRERDQQELSLRMLLGVSVMSLRGFAVDEVRDIYARALELCREQTTSPEAFMAQWFLGLFNYFRANLPLCQEIAEELVDRAARLDDALLASEAACAFGVTLVERGKFDGALDQCDRIATLCETQPDRQGRAFAGQDPAVTGECYAARALWALGYPDRAMVRIDRARALARPVSPAETRVIATYFAALLHQLRGEARDAHDQAASAIALADDYGLSVWVALSRIILGWARVEQRAFEDGIGELRRGIAAYEATGARLWRAHSLGLLAQALTASGHHDRALEAVVEALDLVRETGEDGGAADLHRIHGDVLLSRSAANVRAVSTEAEECLTRALTIARAQQAKSWELRAATSLARLYVQQGKMAKARRLVAPVLEWFTEGHETADVRAARAVLGKSSGQAFQPA